MNNEEKVLEKTKELKKIPIIVKAFSILDALPQYLRYHIKNHTEDVFHEAIIFSITDNLDEKRLIEIATAAAWHDVGFLIQPDDNEKEAVKLFIKESKNMNNINTKNIENMIMDTKLHATDQGPKIFMSDSISAYLLDADVSNFGREDFREKSNLIAEEKNINMDNAKERLEFLKFTLSLLINHKWYTPAAQKLRQKQKTINTENLKKEIFFLENMI